jgi:hypothetical protein
MKKAVFFFLCAVALAGCKEKNDLVYLNTRESISIDSSYVVASVPAAQPKHVFVEDMTGVQCGNCPNAHIVAEDIAAQYPGQVSIIATHGRLSPLCDPYRESKQDFRTDEGNTIFNMLGPPPSLPMGDIDRMRFTSDPSAISLYTAWKANAATRLALTPPVNLQFVKKTYNQADSTVRVTMKVTFTQDVNVPCYISAALTESNVTDLQKYSGSATGVDTNYVHMNALRKMIDDPKGKKLGDKFVKGQTYLLSFDALISDKKIPTNKWNADNMKIVAYVHHRDELQTPKDLEVLQVAETTVK